MRLGVVICSTRPGRLGPIVAKWFEGHARAHAAFATEVVDLAEVNLPLLDEPEHPRFKRYTKDVWQSTSSWLANPDTSVFDTAVTVKPLGEMPAIRALGQVCMTHGFTHLGELELCRTLLGLRPAIGV